MYNTAVNIQSIDINMLLANSKRYIIIDLDNTIAPWNTYDIKEEVKEWLISAKYAGFKICILSNNCNHKRTQRIANSLKIFCCPESFRKPAARSYQKAMKIMKCTHVNECIMIGDQLFGDMLGAQKLGIDGILVDPIYKKEAFVTKFQRVRERMRGRAIKYQYK